MNMLSKCSSKEDHDWHHGKHISQVTSNQFCPKRNSFPTRYSNIITPSSALVSHPNAIEDRRNQTQCRKPIPIKHRAMKQDQTSVQIDSSGANERRKRRRRQPHKTIRAAEACRRNDDKLIGCQRYPSPRFQHSHQTCLGC